MILGGVTQLAVCIFYDLQKYGLSKDAFDHNQSLSTTAKTFSFISIEVNIAVFMFSLHPLRGITNRMNKFKKVGVRGVP